MYKLMKSVIEIIESLREEGYIHDFSIEPDELIIEKTERYEGDSNPSDSAIIYAITAKDGTKGVLVDSYGVYADPKLASIIGDIPVREEHDLQDN